MDNQHIQQHIQKVREALKASTPDWHDNGNEIVSKRNPLCGIGGFLKDEDNYLAANSPTWLQQSIDMLEQQQREIERLKQVDERECKFTLELKKEIEFLRMQRESLESQLQHYRGYQ